MWKAHSFTPKRTLKCYTSMYIKQTIASYKAGKVIQAHQPNRGRGVKSHHHQMGVIKNIPPLDIGIGKAHDMSSGG